MEYKWIEAFMALVEYLNFSRAAESLYISQPALSKQIASLESYLGVILFSRDKRTVELTEMGKLFLPEAQDMLKKMNQTVDKMKKAEAAEQMNAGVLSIVFDRTLPYMFFADSSLVDALMAIRKEYPLISCEFKYENYLNLEQAMMNPPGDVMVTLVPAIQFQNWKMSPECTHILRQDKWLLAVPEEYANCSLSNEDDLKILNSLYFLDIRERAFLLNSGISCLAYFGLKPQIRTCDDWQEILMRAQLGEGFYLIPQVHAKDYDIRGISYIGLEEAGSLSSLYMVLTWNVNNKNSLLKLLLDEINLQQNE